MQMEAAKRKRASSTRNPLSDTTNSNASAFTKSVTKCNSRTTTSPGTIGVEGSKPISVFYGQRDASDEKKSKKKRVANPVSSRPIPKASHTQDKSDGVEGLDLPKAKPFAVPCRKKQHGVPYEQIRSKEVQLQDFIIKQKAYFKEIDEFELSEEEVESIDELD